MHVAQRFLSLLLIPILAFTDLQIGESNHGQTTFNPQPSTLNFQPSTFDFQPPTWLHTAQADWMEGERDHLDVRTLDALGTPYGFDHGPRGAIRLRSRPGRWSKHPGSPVIYPGPEHAWDDAVVSEAKVLYDGQAYHMWYAGRKRGPQGRKTPMDLGYATSSDGIHWTKFHANPVLIRGPLGSFDENIISASHVLYDGQAFHMWFSAVDFGGDWSINYATSADGVHWAKSDANPLLEETHDDRWDAVYVAEPCVIFNGSGFEMWYNGASATTQTLLGYARSVDGIQWERFEENRPVLDVATGGNWDDFAVARGSVLYDGERYQMWYEGHSGATWRIGYATSADGVTWERGADNPIIDLGPEGAWDSKVASEPNVLFDGQTYRMWYSGYDGDRYRVGLATAPAVYNEQGTFVSPPVAGRQPVEWGALTYDLSLPPQTNVRWDVATSDDGKTWSAWTVAATASISGVHKVDLTRLGLPRSRYLCYRATLTTSNPDFSPLIREVAISEATPDFAVSLARGSASLRPGQRVEIEVSFQAIRGFAEPVHLSVEGLPASLSATWAPGFVTPSGSATLNLEASQRALPGTIPLTLTAQSGDLIRAAALSLVLLDPLPTATPTATPMPTPTPTPLPPGPPVPPAAPRLFWQGIGIASGSAVTMLIWLLLLVFIRLPKPTEEEAEETPRRRRPLWRHWVWGILLFAVALLGVYQSGQYVKSRRQEWEDYRATIRPGVHVAGVDASRRTADEIRQAVEARAVAPYRRTLAVHFLDRTVELDTAGLGFQTNLDDIVAQAVAVGAQESGQEAFKTFLLHDPEPYEVNIPLTYTFDYDLLEPLVTGIAAEIEVPLVEHHFDDETLRFTRGRTGVHLDTKGAFQRLKAAVPDLAVREVTLPVVETPPRDWSDEEIGLAISRAVANWNEPPLPASSQQITIPFDEERWIGPGTPAADWKPTREMTGYTFSPGRMGWTLDVTAAQQIIRQALDSGAQQAVARVITDVAPAPLTLVDIKPMLMEIAAHLDGFTGFYVQDLTTGQEIRHRTYVTTSGMSMIKVAIMVTAYRTLPRPFPGPLQDAMAQMIAHSINEKSNQVILQIGEGDFQKGLEQVNETLAALGMHQTTIRSAYRTEEGPFYDPIEAPERPAVEIPPEDQVDLWPDTAMQTSLSDQAILFEALYRGTQGEGRLLEAFPNLAAGDCQEMLDLLKTNPTRTFLGPGFADDVPMAHKNAFGGGQRTDERMNVGIIWPPGGRPYLVGLYQWDQIEWIHWLRVWPQQIEFSMTLYNYFTMPPTLPAPNRPK